jgi:hypothetical protein
MNEDDAAYMASVHARHGEHLPCEVCDASRDRAKLLKLIAELACPTPRRVNYVGDPAGATWEDRDCGRCGTCIARTGLGLAVRQR